MSTSRTSGRTEACAILADGVPASAQVRVFAIHYDPQAQSPGEPLCGTPGYARTLYAPSTTHL